MAMKRLLFLLSLPLLLFSCEKQANTSLLTGQWRLVAQRTKSGDWENVSRNTIMHINANGTIRYTDTTGQEQSICCFPNTYKTEGTKVFFLNWFNCPMVKCVIIETWTIQTLDSQILEVHTDRQLQERYQRVN